jgi:hypothetical protein
MKGIDQAQTEEVVVVVVVLETLHEDSKTLCTSL